MFKANLSSIIIYFCGIAVITKYTLNGISIDINTTDFITILVIYIMSFTALFNLYAWIKILFNRKQHQEEIENSFGNMKLLELVLNALFIISYIYNMCL